MLRLIKLKQLYGELENLTPQEELFFKLHENLHEHSSGRLYDENDEWVVFYDYRFNYFRYNYYRFFLIFNNKFNINVIDFNILCQYILSKYLNCKQLIPVCNSSIF